MDKNDMWNLLEDRGIATDEEIRLVTDICGFTEQALFDILYARTGYRNFEQLEAEIG